MRGAGGGAAARSLALPLSLDPATLRWLAGVDERESNRCEAEARACDGRAAGEPRFDWPGHADAYRSRAIDHRRRARWLRGLARGEAATMGEAYERLEETMNKTDITTRLVEALRSAWMLGEVLAYPTEGCLRRWAALLAEAAARPAAAQPTADPRRNVGDGNPCSRPDCYAHDGETCAAGKMERGDCPRWRETQAALPAVSASAALPAPILASAAPISAEQAFRDTLTVLAAPEEMLPSLALVEAAREVQRCADIEGGAMDTADAGAHLARLVLAEVRPDYVEALDNVRRAVPPGAPALPLGGPLYTACGDARSIPVAPRSAHDEDPEIACPHCNTVAPPAALLAEAALQPAEVRPDDPRWRKEPPTVEAGCPTIGDIELSPPTMTIYLDAAAVLLLARGGSMQVGDVAIEGAPEHECVCGTNGEPHERGCEGCEYHDHHCETCHREGHCTASACGSPVGPSTRPLLIEPAPVEVRGVVSAVNVDHIPDEITIRCDEPLPGGARWWTGRIVRIVPGGGR